MPKSKLLKDMLLPYLTYNPLTEVEYGFDPSCAKAYRKGFDVITIVCQSANGNRNVWGRRYLQASPNCKVDYMGVINSNGNCFAVANIIMDNDDAVLLDLVPLRKINGSWFDSLTSTFTKIAGAIGFNVVDNGMYTPSGQLGRVMIVKNKKVLLNSSYQFDNNTTVWEGL